jgi:hypothetical protein
MLRKRAVLITVKLCFCIAAATAVFIHPSSLFANVAASPSGACPLGCIDLHARCICD